MKREVSLFFFVPSNTAGVKPIYGILQYPMLQHSAANALTAGRMAVIHFIHVAYQHRITVSHGSAYTVVRATASRWERAFFFLGGGGGVITP